MLAWHFLSEDKRLGYGDGRLVEVGVPLECEGDPILCDNGMHGSVRLLDALRYAAGPIVCRVEIEGDVIEGEDKLCGRRRTVLWMLDATKILHEFACSCAEDALALVAQPDERSVAAIEAKRKWINGEITDEEFDSTRAAAWDAALAASRAARDAALAASRAAARAAAEAVAWSAAEAAARDAAAWAAAESASRDAAEAAARADAWAVAEAVALDVAGAARAAARAKQNERLTRRRASNERDRVPGCTASRKCGDGEGVTAPGRDRRRCTEKKLK
jgi:hypothetical protein